MNLASHQTRSWELANQTRFELRRPLGSGSFGVVYEVFDRERGAKVALKVLKRIDAEELYRFKREFRALAELTHPSFLRLYELLCADDRWFYTMELVEGTDAIAFVRPGHVAADAPTLPAPDDDDDGASSLAAAPSPSPELRFDDLRLRSMLLQLVEGLAALHAAGTMHRDVKPSNVLVTREGRVVLVDFGLAVRLSNSGELSRSALVGTPEYLAPELIRGQPATAASDWYAVGVMLFEALTGQLPFVGPLQDVLSRKVTEDAPAPGTLAPDLPADLARLCVELLSRKPEARPGSSALLERLGGDEAPRASLRRTFVGREAQRAKIEELFRASRRDGAAGVALVAGVSGIGKSTLLARVCADLREVAPSAMVLSGRCWEHESVPYKAIDGLIDPLSRHLKALPAPAVEALLPRETRALARLFPVLDQVEAIADAPVAPLAVFDANERRRAAFRGLRTLLGRLSRERPLVLVIDDLQWGDRDSGALLVDLLAPPAPPPLFLIAAYRSEDAGTAACLTDALPALRAMAGAEVRVASIALDSLPPTEATELARALLPDALTNGQAAADVAREGAGHPFFIRQLAELARQRATRGAPVATQPALSLEALLEARVAELPPPARALLEIVAVAGRPVDRAIAARAAELGDDEPAAYGALSRAQLVRGRTADHATIEPYHDRIREAVAAGLSPGRRASAFRRLAAALDGTGKVDAETLATYFLEAGDRDRALSLTTLAAEEASRALAFDRAARLYQVALDLRGPGPAGALHEALGLALIAAGRGAEAAAALTRAAEEAPPDRVFDLRRRAVEQLLFAGRVEEGMSAMRAYFVEARVTVPRVDALVVAGFLLRFAWLALRGFPLRARQDESATMARRIDAKLAVAKAFVTVETLRGAYLAVRATGLALQTGDARRAFTALSLLSLYATGLLGARHAFTRRAVAALDALGAAHHVQARGSTSLLAGISLVLRDRLVEGRETLARAAVALKEERADGAWETNLVSEFTFQSLLWTGAWGALSEQLPPVLERARERGNEHLARALTLRFGHVPSLLADDPDAAGQRLLAGQKGWWPARFSTLDCFVLWSTADVMLYAAHGSGVAPRAHVERAWPELVRSRLLRVRAVAFAALNARARASLAFAASEGLSRREREGALGVADRAAAALRALPGEIGKGLGELAGAGVDAIRGDTGAALAGLVRAEAVLDAIGAAHYLAAARRRRGALVGGDEGRALVTEADAFFTSQGARDPERLAAMLAPGRRAR